MIRGWQDVAADVGCETALVVPEVLRIHTGPASHKKEVADPVSSKYVSTLLGLSWRGCK